MTLEEYKNALVMHDWYYNWSDDIRVWRRGEENHKRLLTIAQEGCDDYKKAYNEEWSKYFHKKEFSFAKPPFEV